MKKCMNNKGYIMTEALIISGIVLAALILIYANFARLNKNYNESYYFNNVNGIYALNQVATFLDEDGIDSIVSVINKNTKEYVDITNCSYATDTKYCELLLDGANIKHLLFTYNNKNYISAGLSRSNPYDLKLQNFVKTIDDSVPNYGVLLIAEFYDGYYAAIPYGYGLNLLEIDPYEATVTTYAGTAHTTSYAATRGESCSEYHVSGWGGSCDSDCHSGCVLYQSGMGLDGGWECNKWGCNTTWSCPQGGTNSNGTCVKTTYTCETGDTPNGSTCYHYECPNGGTLNGTTCE